VRSFKDLIENEIPEKNKNYSQNWSENIRNIGAKK